MPLGWVNCPQQTSGGGGFSAATFTDQAQGLAFVDEETDIINGTDVSNNLSQEALPDGEVLLQVFDFQQYLAV